MYRTVQTSLSVLLAIAASAACAFNPISPVPTSSPVPPSPAATVTPPAPTGAPEEAASATQEPSTPASASAPHGLRAAYFGGAKIMLWTEGAGSRPLADASNVVQVRISDDG
jgi:hypothetical protein